MCYYGYCVTGTLNIDTNATPELLLERNIKLAEKLSTQNKVGNVMCCIVFSVMLLYMLHTFHYIVVHSEH